MLRIANIEDVPLHAIVVCAACETSVYERVHKPEGPAEGIHFKRLKQKMLSVPSMGDYHLAWCFECKGLLEFNSQILYIPADWIDEITEGRTNIGRRIMMFAQEQQVKQRGMRP